MSKRKYFGWSTQNVSPSSSTTNLYDIDLIKQDILNEFMTKQGDRVMLPTFGSKIWDILFNPMIESNENDIENDVIRIVGNDPRVSYKSMSMSETDHGITISVILTYNMDGSTINLLVDFQSDTENLI